MAGGEIFVHWVTLLLKHTSGRILSRINNKSRKNDFFKPQVRKVSFSALPDSSFPVFRSEKYLTRSEKWSAVIYYFPLPPKKKKQSYVEFSYPSISESFRESFIIWSLKRISFLAPQGHSSQISISSYISDFVMYTKSLSSDNPFKILRNLFFCIMSIEFSIPVLRLSCYSLTAGHFFRSVLIRSENEVYTTDISIPISCHETGFLVLWKWTLCTCIRGERKWTWSNEIEDERFYFLDNEKGNFWIFKFPPSIFSS